MRIRNFLHLLITTLLITISGTAYSQLKLAPLQKNEQLSTFSERQGFAALDQHFTTELDLNIMSGKTERICINLGKLAGGFDTLIIVEPVIPQGGVASVEQECVVFEADDRPTRISDTLILLALDADSFEYHYQLVVNVIPSRGLPFIDEFSYPGPYPDPGLWLDRHVFINNGLSKLPPSIGVATFDGVDEFGNPYGLGRGSSDTLTSTFLDLTGAVDPVFEFYYQPRGRGFICFPQEEDSLILEFRDQEGNWKQHVRYAGIDCDTVPNFIFSQVILADSLIYDGFQFRFRNLSRRDGILGTWHLDYMQVRDASVNQEVYPDVALKQIPTSLFKRYTAIPSAHFTDFVGAYIADSNHIFVGNYFPGEQIMNDSRVLITETQNNTEILRRSDDENLFKSSATSGDGRNQIDLAPGMYHFRNALRTRNTIVSRIQSMNIQPDDSLNFRMVYTFENSERSAAFERNNTTTRDNWVNDFYAYDDGTAEQGIYIQGGREFDMVALEYETPVDDSLKGIRLYFPHVFAQGDRQRFKLMVWGADLEAGPLYEKIYDNPVFPERFGEIIGSFTTFALKDDRDRNIAIPIPAGKFHVGWQQLSSSSTFGLYVGFDRDHPEATKHIRYNALGVWDTIDMSNDDVRGAIMMRPVFGKGVVSTSVKDKSLSQSLKIYPNPINVQLNISGDFSPNTNNYQIIDMHGRVIQYGIYQQMLRVEGLSPGLYLLRILDTFGEVKAMQKFIKQ